MNKKSRIAQIFQACLFALSVGMLAYFCITGNNLAILLQTLPTLNFFWLLCAFSCVFINWLMDSRILYGLVGQAYGGEYRWKTAFRVTMVGQYFAAITPFGCAGQPMMLLTLTRQGVSSGVALSALVQKFLLYQSTISVYSALVILFKFRFFRERIPGFMALAFVGFLCQAGAVALLFFFAHNRSLTSKLVKLCVRLLGKLRFVKDAESFGQKAEAQLDFYLENNRALNKNRRMTLKLYGCAFLQLTAMFSIPFFLYKAFHGEGFPITDMVAAQSFVTMISNYMPLPGAAGAAEGSFLLIFRLFFDSGVIMQAMLLWRLIAYYSSIVVGSFFAGIGSRREKLASAHETAK